jgi:hypothetical protein
MRQNECDDDDVDDDFGSDGDNIYAAPRHK